MPTHFLSRGSPIPLSLHHALTPKPSEAHSFHCRQRTRSACLSKPSLARLPSAPGHPRMPPLILPHLPSLALTTLPRPLRLCPLPRMCLLTTSASVQTSPSVQGHLKSSFFRGPSAPTGLQRSPTPSSPQHPKPVPTELSSPTVSLGPMKSCCFRFSFL